MAQGVEALSSNLSTAKKKKRISIINILEKE
jgi:hypothetical protein